MNKHTRADRVLLSIQMHVLFLPRQPISQTDRKSALSVSEVHREVMSDGSPSELSHVPTYGRRG